MKKLLSVDIIPAQPDFLLVYKMDEDFEVEEQVIAWRIETYSPTDDRGELLSFCEPLTVEGNVPSNCVGVQNPDMTITVFGDSIYKSIETLNEVV